MRSIRFAAAAACVMLAPMAAGAQQNIKLGYINSQSILAAAPGRSEAQAQFEREVAAYKQQVQRMGDSLNLLIADYNKQEISLSPAAKEAKQKSIRAKEDEYQGRKDKLEEQMQQRQVELVQPIMDQIQRALDEIRTEQGYTMIFDVGAAAQIVVSADKNLELTDQVIRRLQQYAAAKGTTTQARPAAGAPAQAPSGVTRPKTPPSRG